MDSKSYSVLNTIICDDVRKEDNGKEILIGIYNDAMLIDTMPAVLPIFGIRFLVKVERMEYKEITGKVVDPNGIDIVGFKGHIIVNNTEHLSSFFFKISPMVFHAYGRYEIHLGLDCPPEKVYTFSVLPKDQTTSGGTSAAT